ncbi:MAG TPA: hypothetical protein VNM37_18050, partial [Candidatus Dormibacteraeota bacterium]|nr:hypothetical protein [Candidatus Dormibacteraeota bacterium]
PGGDELKVLQGVLDQDAATYRKNPEAATKLLGVGSFKNKESLDRAELAAWTTVASLLLNLDETVTKG